MHSPRSAFTSSCQPLPCDVQVLKAAMKEAPKDGTLHVVLGLMHSALRDLPAAEMHFQEATRLLPEDYSAWNRVRQGSVAGFADAAYAQLFCARWRLHKQIVGSTTKHCTGSNRHSLQSPGLLGPGLIRGSAYLTLGNTR